MIYFVKDTVTQAIKIGYSADPEERLPELQTGNPHRLILLGTIRGNLDREAQLHSRFAPYRMVGEWFSGDIIEEVLEIIEAAKQGRRQIRRTTVTEPMDDSKDYEDFTPTTAPAALSIDDVGTLDNDSGIRGLCRIPGLKMKRFSLKLTESPVGGLQGGQTRDNVTCGMQIKYVLEFETNVKASAAADSCSLGDLQNALIGSAGNQGLRHLFMDEDNALIPFSPEPSHCHIVGGRNAITGEQGWAFRVLVASEKTLSPTHGHTIKDIFTGDNYVGEHPLKKARKMVVSCPLPEKPRPEVPKPPKSEEVLSAYVNFEHGDRRKEIHIPDGWYYWTHFVNNFRNHGRTAKEEVIRDATGRVIAVAVEVVGGNVNLGVTVRKMEGK